MHQWSLNLHKNTMQQPTNYYWLLHQSCLSPKLQAIHPFDCRFLGLIAGVWDTSTTIGLCLTIICRASSGQIVASLRTFGRSSLFNYFRLTSIFTFNYGPHYLVGHNYYVGFKNTLVEARSYYDHNKIMSKRFWSGCSYVQIFTCSTPHWLTWFIGTYQSAINFGMNIFGLLFLDFTT